MKTLRVLSLDLVIFCVVFLWNKFVIRLEVLGVRRYWQTAAVFITAKYLYNYMNSDFSFL